MTQFFLTLLHSARLPEPIPEYRFHPERRWRFDYAWPAARLALEVEGGIWIRGGGRHNRARGMLADMEKYNAAAVGGWRVIRVTPAQLLSQHTVQLLKDCHIQTTADKPLQHRG